MDYHVMGTESKAALLNGDREIDPTIPASSEAYPLSSVGTAWYALALLCVVTFISQLDRHLPSIIVTPLKTEFGISDTQFGLLHGYGFALTYALFGIPFGRLVDRHNRRNIILIGLLSWAVLTMLSAFVENYTQLFLLRTGVGIGEAVLAPAAYSLLIDYFEAGKRGRAVSVYYMAQSVGGGGSLLLGGLLLSILPVSGLNFAGLITLTPWRLLFLCAGLPGIFVGFLLLTIREPKRRLCSKENESSAGAFFGFLWKHKRYLGMISIAGTLISIAAVGVAAWMPTLLERSFGLAPAQTALPIGAALIIGSISGTLLSGILSDRLLGHGVSGARLRPMLLGYVLLLPSAFLSIAPLPWLAILLFGLLAFSLAMVASCVPLALQEPVPTNMRGQIIAVQFVIYGLCSIGLSPILVGAINDYVFHSDDMLRWSLFVLVLPISVVGIALCHYGLNRSTNNGTLNY